MHRHKDIEKEIESIAPGLSHLGKEPAQRVPEGYFEAFTDSLMADVQRLESDGHPSQSQPAATLSWLDRLLRPALLFPALATVIIAAVGLWLWNSGDATADAISSAEAYEYCYDHLDEFEDAWLATLVEDFAVEDLLSDEEIEEYMLDNWDEALMEEIL